MNNNPNEAKLKANAVDFIGPLLKRLNELAKEINVSENSQMATTIDQIRTEVLKRKDSIRCIQNWDWELIGLFGKIERQIDSWIDHNEKRDEMKDLKDILCMFPQLPEKARDLPLEATASSSRSYQGSKLFKDFKDLKELDVHSILCLYSLGTFPKNRELEKRFVIYWWIGLGLLPRTSWKEAKMRGNEIYSGLKEKGFLESVHNGKQNQVINRCTINPAVHKWLLSPNESNVIFSFDQSEHSSSPFFREWFNKRVHINLKQKYLNADNVPIEEDLQVVNLGSWCYTEAKADSNANDHIEIENPDLLKKLSEKSQKMTYLSLRGISGTEEIPESIGKLENLIILDLKSCHNLIKLPQQPRSTLRKKLSHHTRFKKLIGWALPQESWFNKLMVLDISGCYLLDHMPKWISELCNLEVLKGFLVGRVGKKNESCQLGDLSKLINLKKLSIRTTTDMSPEVFRGFNSLENLLILTITWGGHKIPDYSLPKNLEKLDIRCYPEVDVSKLKNCAELTKLKKLYIRGGNLTKIPSHDNWKVEKLRLRFLENLVSTEEEVRALFPNLNYVEYVGCPRPDKFPNDGSCWIKEKADNNQNEAKLKASVEDFIGPLNIQSTSSIIKKGGFSYADMQEKEMDPTGITRIVKIIIAYSRKIEGLSVYFERNDTRQYTYECGNFDDATDIYVADFETNEYITSVNGFMERDDDYGSVCFLKSLVLKTNLWIYGPCGRKDIDDCKPLEFSVPLGGQIIGFHAYYSDNVVHTLGVYVRQSNGTIIKKGPFLGDGGIVKRMDPMCITRIVKIMIYHDYHINGLTVHFEHNGTPQWTGLWGKNEGTLDEINFKTNEYIKSVKGNYGSTSILNSLVLVTNLDIYGPYGTEGGRSFEHTSLHGQIISFFACVGINCVFDLGVHIKVPISKSVLCGGSGGSARDMNDVSSIYKIWHVNIRYDDDTIHALSVLYKLDVFSFKETPLWGGETGKLTEIYIFWDEYIKSVRGYVGYFGDIFTVRSLELITDRRSYGPYGKEEGTPFELSAFDGEIIGFHGRSGEYLNAIGVYVKWPELEDD